EVGYAGGGQDLVVDQELARAVAASSAQDHIRRIRDDFRLAAELEHRLVADGELDGGGGDGRARPQRVYRDAIGRELARHAQYAHAHAVFRHGVRDVRREPARVHVERRREVENMRVLGALEMRQAGL